MITNDDVNKKCLAYSKEDDKWLPGIIALVNEYGIYVKLENSVCWFYPDNVKLEQ